MSGVLHGVVASLKAAAAAATDSFWKYVTLLLNTTSTNGAQNNTFLDSSTNNFTVTRNGDTTQGSFNPYMPTGYWSGYFDGTGDWLSVPDNAAFTLGSGDFTVEAWIYNGGTGVRQLICGQIDSAGTIPSLSVYLEKTAANKLLGAVGSGSTSYTATSTADLPLNQWVHVAFVRNGNTGTLYINGSSDGTVSLTGVTVNDSTNTFSIGRVGEFNSLFFTGYISNFRLVKGTAVYTANFTPTTTPLTAITNTSLLCLQDNRFKDNSTNAFAITVNGDTRISKFAPFSPPASYSTASYGGSGYFDGTGDYLSIADNAAFDLAASDFTVETWVNFSSIPSPSGASIFVAQWDGSGVTDLGWFFYLFNSAGTYQLFLSYSTNGSNQTNLLVNLAAAPAIGSWNHVAFVRSGNNFLVFWNGTQVGTTQTLSATIFNSSRVISIAQLPTGFAYNLTGYLSNLRIVKGTAVYTANFTPPTTPLTAITNTSLLLNFTNAGIYDAATINNGQTVGNAQVSTTQAKWSPTSMAFDGTGDYVTVIDKPELRLGSGDFTIEGWVYLTATGVAYGLVSKGTATTGWSVNVTSGNKLQFSYTATQLTGATSLASGTWYYFAVVRSGTATGNLKVYLNGSVDATSAGAVTDAFTQTNSLYVGADRVAGAVLNGYLQDVRVTNGYARTITTPTAAFPTL
jgi:hypothetical protein